MSKRYSYLNSYRMQAYNNALTDWYYQDRVFRPAGRPVIFNQQGLVLITKMKDLWAIPGGGLDWGESLATNIARESFEELGVQADIDQIIFIQDYLAEKPPLGWHHLEYFYSIKNNEDFENILETYQTASHTHELDELMWCDIDSFPENFM
ncbi:MAG: NUDIX hydrolase, partial [Patescibacteria group bacterium]|nr:NUDIX hydrolase [Patescibacteria group bacterium]